MKIVFSVKLSVKIEAELSGNWSSTMPITSIYPDIVLQYTHFSLSPRSLLLLIILYRCTFGGVYTFLQDSKENCVFLWDFQWKLEQDCLEIGAAACQCAIVFWHLTCIYMLVIMLQWYRFHFGLPGFLLIIWCKHLFSAAYMWNRRSCGACFQW